ncbi:YggT family protein [Vampirovibrio chlorellavorus]|uniref:YggT family protein n=1 Tax=Vampirovibrio chlorellavorus TaxID=758823 RepID=UPI0026EF928C|nr:YggT family protein [Vampirovibrio chlorellavorus]
MSTTVWEVLFYACNLYKILLLARILLTWLPNIDWYNQPFQGLRAITDPVMAPFSRLIPPMGGIDFSPILLFFVLSLVQSFLQQQCPFTCRPLF